MERFKAIAGREVQLSRSETVSFAWREGPHCNLPQLSCLFPHTPIAGQLRTDSNFIPNLSDLPRDEVMSHKDDSESHRASSEWQIPFTLARHLDGLFARHPLARHSAVCKALEISTKTLHQLGDTGQIVYRLKGSSWRYYAREDVEAFIRRMTCLSIFPDERMAPSKARIGSSILSSRSMANDAVFTAARAKQKRELLASGSRRRKSVSSPKVPSMP
jgi:DNA-binding transcriptional MerR regulator